MINTKLVMGGHPSVFGKTVIQWADDNFSQTDPTYTKGNYQLFQTTSFENIKEGDIVAYFSKIDENTEKLEVEFKPLTPLTAQVQKPIIKNYQETTTEITTSNKSIVSIVKVATKGTVTEIKNGKTHFGFSYYTSDENEQNKAEQKKHVVIMEDVIGVAITNNSFVISCINYCASFDSCLTLILTPVIFLVVLNVLSIIYYKKYSATSYKSRKANFRQEELKKESLSESSDYAKIKQIQKDEQPKHAPVRPTQVTDNTQTNQLTKPPKMPERKVKVAPVRPERKVNVAPTKPTRITKTAPIKPTRVAPPKPPIPTITNKKPPTRPTR